jgi:outer membrane protein assembly factor BamB
MRALRQVVLGLLLLARLLSPIGAAPRAPADGGLTDFGLAPFYGQSAWPTIHRDSRNSDFVPFVSPMAPRVQWTALDGAAVFVAPTIGPEGHLYATTGQGPGASHLHAFDHAGRLLWESAPQQSLDDLDSLAVLNAPLVDREGAVYVADANQFWSFTADGQVRWVAPLPQPGRTFASAFLTNEGDVGGITLDGQVLLFQRADGALAAPIFDLPRGADPVSPTPPPGLWGGGLLDPQIIPTVFRLTQFTIANTPAVDPASGRIYITAAGATLDAGVLYALALAVGQITIAWQATMGAGNGTSPALSPDGRQVYAADGSGLLTAFDAGTGAVLWSAAHAAPAASPTIGPDGVVYTGARSLLALQPTDGHALWEANFDELARRLLPALDPQAAPVLVSGQPIASVDSVISVAADRLWAALTLGYEIQLPGSAQPILQPRLTAVAAIDPRDGRLQSYTFLRDTVDGIISLDADGSLYVCHAAYLSSLNYYGINPYLPPPLRAPGPPTGGITALEPGSFVDLARGGVRWAQELSTAALAHLPDGDLAAATTALQRGSVQLGATAETVLDALARQEIDLSTATARRVDVLTARQRLRSALELLAGPNPSPTARQAAAQAIILAQSDLARAADLCAWRSCLWLPLLLG